MTGIFLAPHNDDETLFGAYTIMRYHPLVVVVFRSEMQEELFGIRAAVREAETHDAMAELHHLAWKQWPYPDDGKTSDAALAEAMDALIGARDGPIWAPAVTERGHRDHNQVGRVAAALFPEVTHYMTYDYGGEKQRGKPVHPEPAWIAFKLRALACYRSQIVFGPNRFFSMDLHEYVQ